jgi:nitrogen fixation NifU-like protein
MVDDELYREIILEHYHHPRFKGALPDADLTAEGMNPLCGDEVTLYLKTDGDRIVEAHFDGRGCSISQASASMLTEAIRGLTLEEAQVLQERVKAMLTGAPHEPFDEDDDLSALEGVKKYPVRIKCALLAWTTLEEIFSK